jgi:aldehyde:ferredoxin oxidoreductase
MLWGVFTMDWTWDELRKFCNRIDKNERHHLVRLLQKNDHVHLSAHICEEDYYRIVGESAAKDLVVKESLLSEYKLTKEDKNCHKIFHKGEPIMWKWGVYAP